MIISASIGICPLRASGEFDVRRREITWARYTEITWPSTMAMRLMNHTALAPMMFRLSLYSAVPNMFHPNPNGSDASGIISCPWISRSVMKWARLYAESYRHE